LFSKQIELRSLRMLFLKIIFLSAEAQ
jgi:hypothetical protein